jgi:hypothetical protein
MDLLHYARKLGNVVSLFCCLQLLKHCPTSHEYFSSFIHVWNNSFIHQYFYSTLLGSGRLFSFGILHTLRRIPWMGISLSKRSYLHSGQHKQRINVNDIYAWNGIQTHEPSVRAGEDGPCLILRCHGDQWTRLLLPRKFYMPSVNPSCETEFCYLSLKHASNISTHIQKHTRSTFVKKCHAYSGMPCRLFSQVNKQTPWSESARELYRPNDRRFSAKWLPTFADKGYHVVSVTDPYCRILGFLDRSRYFSIK